MELRIFNPDPKYTSAKLVEPTMRGYLYAAANVNSGWSPIILPSASRSRLLDKMKNFHPTWNSMSVS
jgi:hypothetical protein